MPFPPVFFIAHAGADLDPARALYHLLQPHVAVWLDKEDLFPGDIWPVEIQRAQRAARATVVLVSARYDTAYYLQDEVHAAIRLLRQPGQEHRTIPVFLDGFPSADGYLPYGLTIAYGLDAKALGMDGVARELLALVPRLTGAAPARPATPPPAAPPPTVPTVRQLHGALCGLLDGQFTEILAFEGKDALRYIAGPSASRSQRALDVALWAETQGPATLSALADAVRRLAPSLLP